MMEWGLYEFFRKQREFERRYVYILRNSLEDPRQVLAREAEQAVTERLEEIGYRVSPTSRNARYDLLVEGAARVEVKASTYNEAAGQRGGRYQAHFHNQADLLVFACRNGDWHFFVIPTEALGERRNIAIWSEEPERYTGQWRGFLEQWSVLPGIIDEARRERGQQLSFW
jgi:hypothetical protein